MGEMHTHVRSPHFLLNKLSIVTTRKRRAGARLCRTEGQCSSSSASGLRRTVLYCKLWLADNASSKVHVNQDDLTT